MNPVVVTGDDRSVQLRIDTSVLRDVFRIMPKVAFFWTRDFLGRALVAHRVKWLGTKTTQFGRATGSSRAIRVSRINESTGALEPNEVRYTVTPPERKLSTSADARQKLEEIGATIETSNEILPVHEFGATIRSTRPMFLPVKTRPGNFAEWVKRNPGKTLKFLPSKRDDKTLVYEVLSKRKRGRPRAGETVETRLRLRWILTNQVVNKPTLRLYESWGSLSTERDKQWSTAASKMLADLERGDPRDF